MQIPKPLSREESKRGDLIPDGIYIYEVMQATDEISKTSGNEMIKLKLKIFMPDGRERTLFDYLMSSMEFKLCHFCEANGLWDKYESGNLEADDCWGKSGELKIYIQKGKNGYSDQSSVGDYLLNDEQSAAKLAAAKAKAPTSKQEDFISDDVPF